MKFGIRKPSLQKSIKARTTGKLTRTVKKAINPFYGKKGTGYITDPKRAIYNKVYNKTTVSLGGVVGDKNTSKKHEGNPEIVGGYTMPTVNLQKYTGPRLLYSFSGAFLIACALFISFMGFFVMPVG